MFNIVGFNHTTILVSDKAQAEIFYTQILGLKKHLANVTCLWIDVGNGQYIHLTKENNSPVKGSFYHTAINVQNLTEYQNNLIEKGVEVFVLDENRNKSLLVKGEETNHFFVNDPDGNLIEFTNAQNTFFNPHF